MSAPLDSNERIDTWYRSTDEQAAPVGQTGERCKVSPDGEHRWRTVCISCARTPSAPVADAGERLIQELRSVIREAHTAGWRHGMGPCVCVYCNDADFDAYRAAPVADAGRLQRPFVPTATERAEAEAIAQSIVGAAAGERDADAELLIRRALSVAIATCDHAAIPCKRCDMYVAARDSLGAARLRTVPREPDALAEMYDYVPERNLVRGTVPPRGEPSDRYQAGWNDALDHVERAPAAAAPGECPACHSFKKTKKGRQCFNCGYDFGVAETAEPGDANDETACAACGFERKEHTGTRWYCPVRRTFVVPGVAVAETAERKRALDTGDALQDDPRPVPPRGEPDERCICGAGFGMNLSCPIHSPISASQPVVVAHEPGELCVCGHPLNEHIDTAARLSHSCIRCECYAFRALPGAGTAEQRDELAEIVGHYNHETMDPYDVADKIIAALAAPAPAPPAE